MILGMNHDMGHVWAMHAQTETGLYANQCLYNSCKET